MNSYYYNGILINKYANGDDFIGKHSDDEHGLDALAGVIRCRKKIPHS
jgi:hypothetical protein